MDWDDLKIVLAIHRAGNLTEAARVLGVNQTTVSRRLQTLHDKLKIRIIERKDNVYSLTQAGELMVSTAESMDEAVHALERQILGFDTRLVGHLRISTIDWISVHNSELFACFAERFPDIQLEVSTCNDPINLTRRDADIALRWTNTPPDHLVGRKLVRAEYAIFAAESLAPGPLSEDALQALPWLGWDEASGARITADWMRRNVPQARVVCRFDSAMAMFGAVKSAMGVAFLPCAYADPEPGIRRLRPVEPSFGMDIWVLTHPDLRFTARVKAFMEHARDYFLVREGQFMGASDHEK